MGCGNCGSSKDGKPGGCKSNGNCSSGGCNRLNVHDWLSDIPLADFGKPFPFVEMSFNNGSRKDFYKMNSHMELTKGQFVVVEGVGGNDIGTVSLKGELVRLQMKKKRVREDSKDMRRIMRIASTQEVEDMNQNKLREKEVLIRSRAIINQLNLNMKMSEIEIQADGNKATYFYTAEERVDFRELIRVLSGEFKMRVEMKQIGIRQEAGKIGGIGSCGRELCCSTWLTSFNSVSTSAARYQNLAINQSKLSGQCGRLKCCLNFELDTYMDALKVFPKKAEKLQTTMGTAYLQKRDIFNNLLWYSYPGSSTLYPLSIERVNEIQALNRDGKKVDEMKPVIIEPKKDAEKELEYTDTVGLFSLKTLDKNSKKRKTNNRKGGSGNRNRKPANKASSNQNRNQQANKPKGNNQQGNKSTAKKAQGQKPQSKKTHGNKPQDNKAQGTKPKSNNSNKKRRPPRPKTDGSTPPPKKD